MSDRTVFDQNKAYQQTLANLARRVITLERNSMWTGAVKQSAVAVNSAAVSVENGVAINNWTEVTSLDLEPGRWILFGEVFHEMTGVGTPTISDVWPVLGIRVRWTSIAPDYQDTWRESELTSSVSTSGFGHVKPVSQETALEVKAKTTSTAELQLGVAANPSTMITYYTYGVNLLAFPG
jgi:hypothetical protein